MSFFSRGRLVKGLGGDEDESSIFRFSPCLSGSTSQLLLLLSSSRQSKLVASSSSIRSKELSWVSEVGDIAAGFSKKGCPRDEDNKTSTKISHKVHAKVNSNVFVVYRRLRVSAAAWRGALRRSAYRLLPSLESRTLWIASFCPPLLWLCSAQQRRLSFHTFSAADAASKTLEN